MSNLVINLGDKPSLDVAKHNLYKYLDPGEFKFTAEAFVQRGGHIPEPSLAEVLGIKDNKNQGLSKAIIEYEESGQFEALSNIKKDLFAILQFADLMKLQLGSDLISEADVPLEIIPTQNFFYFQSIRYFKESIVTWLNGYFLAAFSMIRPALENSIFHIYWQLKSGENGYVKLYKWLKETDKITRNLKFKHMLDEIFDENLLKKYSASSKRINMLKDSIYNYWKSLSDDYSHPARTDEAILSSYDRGFDFYEFNLFSNIMSITLRSALFLYVLTYPMCLYPMNPYKKWGPNIIPGLYFDESDYLALVSALGESNIEALRKTCESDMDVAELKEYFESIPEMPIQERLKRWEHEFKEKFDSEEPYIARSKSEIRAMLEAMSYQKLRKKNEINIEEQFKDTKKISHIIMNW